jgi:hypothetical protein
MERASQPGWHGIPPSQDKFVPPISFPEPTEGITTTERNAPLIWCDLIYPDGHSQTVKGFAMAWTNSLVLCQWVEYSMAREAWVNANVVTRRKLEEPRRNRDG